MRKEKMIEKKELKKGSDDNSKKVLNVDSFTLICDFERKLQLQLKN